MKLWAKASHCPPSRSSGHVNGHNKKVERPKSIAQMSAIVHLIKTTIMSVVTTRIHLAREEESRLHIPIPGVLYSGYSRTLLNIKISNNQRFGAVRCSDCALEVARVRLVVWTRRVHMMIWKSRFFTFAGFYTASSTIHHVARSPIVRRRVALEIIQTMCDLKFPNDHCPRYFETVLCNHVNFAG